MTDNLNEIQPNTWLQAFLDCIQCTSDSITTKAIQQALLDQANNRLKFEQVVDQIVQHVRVDDFSTVGEGVLATSTVDCVPTASRVSTLGIIEHNEHN